MASDIDPDAYSALTFDCYGTLVDWQRGIVDYLQPVLAGHDAHVIDEFILTFFAATEPALQAAGGRYADVLRDVLRRLGARLAFTPSAGELDGFPPALAASPPFPDTLEALGRLGARFDLAIVSNVDDDLFATTQAALGTQFAAVVTAQQTGRYKPHPEMFQTALKRLRLKPTQVLHVGQSLFHDIAPAAQLGMATVWIDRNQGAAGAAQDAAAEPSWTFPDLREFADAILD